MIKIEIWKSENYEWKREFKPVLPLVFPVVQTTKDAKLIWSVPWCRLSSARQRAYATESKLRSIREDSLRQSQQEISSPETSSTTSKRQHRPPLMVNYWCSKQVEIFKCLWQPVSARMESLAWIASKNSTNRQQYLRTKQLLLSSQSTSIPRCPALALDSVQEVHWSLAKHHLKTLSKGFKKKVQTHKVSIIIINLTLSLLAKHRADSNKCTCKSFNSIIYRSSTSEVRTAEMSMMVLFNLKIFLRAEIQIARLMSVQWTSSSIL